jgi:hypothetical protein
VEQLAPVAPVVDSDLAETVAAVTVAAEVAVADVDVAVVLSPTRRSGLLSPSSAVS